MTDRELLELAAKAAGIRGEEYPGAAALIVDWEKNRPSGKHIVVNGMTSGWAWCPFDDDGDALRLAVKLEIQVCWHSSLGCAVTYYDCGSNHCAGYGDDAYAATRRAVVRAAAEIGKAVR